MYYFYDDGSHARDVLQEMIGDSEIMAIMTDGYVAYRHLDADGCKIEHLADLAHIRTKFIDWIEVASDEDATEMIWDFNELFRMERQYRRMELTYEQPSFLHFASHKGAEVYAILESLVESCKMKGQSVLRYLERVIQEVNDGNKDYDSLLPGVIAL